MEKSGSIQSKLVVFVTACAVLALNSCKRDSESDRDAPAHTTQNVVEEKPNAPMLPPCPETLYAKLKAEAPATGHHRVFLTWNASLSVSGSDTKALGYCLYRTQMPGKAKDCPTKYPQCEQVNVVPVRGTRCVDGFVKDNTNYYYVAIAIASSGPSTTSQEAIAEVPAAGERNPPPPDADSYPACRVPVASSQRSRR